MCNAFHEDKGILPPKAVMTRSRIRLRLTEGPGRDIIRFCLGFLIVLLKFFRDRLQRNNGDGR